MSDLTRYHKQSKEAHVLDRAAHRMNTMLDGMHRANPLPMFEARVDDRTAQRRLQQIPPDQLYDHYRAHG